LVAGLLLSGNAYAGCIKGDCVNGQGTIVSNGTKYIGEFINGEMGYGTVTTPSGNKYVGELKNYRMHGQGTLTTFDGNVMLGKFKNGKAHGKHKIISKKEGVTIVAIMKNGKFKKEISRTALKKDKSDKKMELASMIDDAKKTCKELGFKEGTEKFTDCSLKLYSQSVELASKNNQQVVMQPQSSGSNVMTIYDPVRDNRALMNQGQRMLSGACTLGINC